MIRLGANHKGKSLTNEFQNGCVTYLERGELSIELYLKRNENLEFLRNWLKIFMYLPYNCPNQLNALWWDIRNWI